MGIDIYAYRNVRKTDKPIEFEEDHYPVDKHDQHLVCFDRSVSDAFDAEHERVSGVRPGYFDGLDDGFYYDYEGEESFISCAYSSYGALRSALMAFVADTGLDRAAFREVIVFSDCEGTIGPKVCAKLLRDFEEHRVAYHDYVEETFEADGWGGANHVSELYERYLDGLLYVGENGVLVYA